MGTASNDLPPQAIQVCADPDLLTAAIANLLDNARRYAPGSAPDLSVTTGNNSVTVMVADRGPGVPPEHREKIFDPLTRLDAARTIDQADGDFGLGLTIAAKAVERYGGSIRCTDRPNGQPGAAFILTLPRA